MGGLFVPFKPWVRWTALGPNHLPILWENSRTLHNKYEGPNFYLGHPFCTKNKALNERDKLSSLRYEGHFTTHIMEGVGIIYEEMITVIRNMKNGKAPGIDNITVELIKNGGTELLQRIFDLLIQVWEQERMPDEWEVGIIYPIYKKGDRAECSNYRGITLLSITYKIFTCLI